MKRESRGSIGALAPCSRAAAGVVVRHGRDDVSDSNGSMGSNHELPNARAAPCHGQSPRGRPWPMRACLEAAGDGRALALAGQTRAAEGWRASEGYAVTCRIAGRTSLRPGTEGRGFADRRPMPDHDCILRWGDEMGVDLSVGPAMRRALGCTRWDAHRSSQDAPFAACPLHRTLKFGRLSRIVGADCGRAAEGILVPFGAGDGRVCRQTAARERTHPPCCLEPAEVGKEPSMPPAMDGPDLSALSLCSLAPALALGRTCPLTPGANRGRLLPIRPCR